MDDNRYVGIFAVRLSVDIRTAIRASLLSNAEIARRLRCNPKTVAKWRARENPADARSGPKSGSRRSLSPSNECLALVLRAYGRLPIDDCLSLLRRWLPTTTRSSLYRCFKRHGLERLEPLVGPFAPPRRHAASKQEGSYLAHILVIWLGWERITILILVSLTGRWVWAEVLEQFDWSGLTKGLRRSFDAAPSPVRWVFVGGGPRFHSFRFNSLDPDPEEFLLRIHKIRTAPAYLGFDEIDERRLAQTTSAWLAKRRSENPQFDVQALVRRLANDVNAHFR